jgi:two-component system CheB/CheR fusion protein
VSDLSRANNDMNNLLAGTGIATIFVDHDLRIMRFTPTASRIINLIQSDIGRPVGHIVSNMVGYNSLIADTQTVLDTLVSKEIEIRITDDMWYTMRILPYRTLDNVIEGAVISFFDISEIKKAQKELLEANNDLIRLAAVVLDSNDAVILQDLEGRILSWNPSAARMYGWSETEALKMNIRDIIPEEQQKEELSVIHQLSRAEIIEPYRTKRITKDGRIMEVILTATALIDDFGKIYAVSTTEREVLHTDK